MLVVQYSCRLEGTLFEREDTLPFLFGTIIFLFELHNAHDKECSKATLSTKWAHPFHRSLQTTPQKTLLLQGWNLWTKKSLFARKCSYFCLQYFITAGTLPSALLLHLVAGPEAGVRVGLAVDAALGVVVPDFSHQKTFKKNWDHSCLWPLGQVQSIRREIIFLPSLILIPI